MRSTRRRDRLSSKAKAKVFSRHSSTCAWGPHRRNEKEQPNPSFARLRSMATRPQMVAFRREETLRTPCFNLKLSYNNPSTPPPPPSLLPSKPPTAATKTARRPYQYEATSISQGCPAHLAICYPNNAGFPGLIRPQHRHKAFSFSSSTPCTRMPPCCQSS